MKVIICGAGQVGWQIARALASEKNDVTIVDQNPDLIRRATETLDVQGVTGFASYPDVLERAGARDADMIIAATLSDEVNMVTCQVAHSIFAVPRKIARLRARAYRDAIYSDLYRPDHLPIDVVISPEEEVAQAVLQRLASPAAFDTERFLGGRVQLLGIQLDEDCPLLMTPLRELNELFPALQIMVLGIRRQENLFTPEPRDILMPGDQVYVMSPADQVTRTLEAFGKSVKKQERVVLVGGGNVGLAVARALEALPDRLRAKVIELDRGQAEAAADALSRTIVLLGDGMDAELLAEAAVDRADAIVTLTDDDRTNLLCAVRGKQAGARMAVALVNDPSLAPLLGPLDIDAYINPRATTVSSILRHVRHGRVRAVYSVGDDEAEVIEAMVLSSSPMAGKAVRDIDFPEGVLVGAVLKGERVMKPAGDLRIEPGDIAVMFALRKDVSEVERLLQVSIEFF